VVLLRLDFYPHEWQRFYDLCGFTDEELKIIELRRRYGGNWTNHRHAAELCLSTRTYDRRLARIKRKIFKFI